MNWITRVGFTWVSVCALLSIIAIVWNYPQFTEDAIAKKTPEMVYWPFLIVVLVVIATFVRLAMLMRKAKEEVGRDAPACPFCLYHPPGTALICPECGRPYSVETARRAWGRFGGKRVPN